MCDCLFGTRASSARIAPAIGSGSGRVAVGSSTSGCSGAILCSRGPRSTIRSAWMVVVSILRAPRTSAQGAGTHAFSGALPMQGLPTARSSSFGFESTRRSTRMDDNQEWIRVLHTVFKVCRRKALVLSQAHAVPRMLRTAGARCDARAPGTTLGRRRLRTYCARRARDRAFIGLRGSVECASCGALAENGHGSFLLLCDRDLLPLSSIRRTVR